MLTVPYRLAIAACFGLLLAAPRPAAAWDYPGHRIVGAIADQILQRYYPAVAAKVYYTLATKGAAGDLTYRSLSQVAVFPDCAKPNNERWCGRPSSDEEKAYAADNKGHAAFHYTDVPLQRTQYEENSAGTEKTDVVHMIEYVVRQLRAKTPADKPAKIAGVKLTDSEALWLLVHLVGDIHQPMHVGARYYASDCKTPVDPNTTGNAGNHFGIGTTVAETQGGNFIALDGPAPAIPPADNLHFYWDGTAVVQAMQAAGVGNSEADFAKLLAASPPNGLATTEPPEKWPRLWVA
ncbi:MAG: hypothetical protein JSR72_13050 [Proteobacteria bacterium]|nr:hypothetical protein [Pseudomonadota bacterium]